jgi:hypothetical protein
MVLDETSCVIGNTVSDGYHSPPVVSRQVTKGCVPIHWQRWFVYIISLGLLGGFIVSPNDWYHQSPKLFLAHSLSGQLIRGNLSGWHNGPQAPVDFHIAEPGDIILCHNPHGAYGYWTHAVLYVGHEQVVDANDFSRGTVLWSANPYRNYDEVILLRPKVPVKLRQKASQAAYEEIGKPYDPLGSLQDVHSTYCSKLIWQSYAKVGVHLCAARGWVLPGDIKASPRVRCIAHWTASEVRQKPCGS